jgi:predicted glycosyltransferase
MRYWFDLLTPKQVLFFRPSIGLLRADGHEVLATSRRYREVEQLAQRLGLKLTFAGARGGKEPLEQLKNSLERMERLLPTVVGFEPDAAVSVASADCARIAFGLRTPHVAVNDSPHSLVAGKLSVPLSHHLITPWIIPYSAWRGFGISRAEISRYKALDPAAWLKRRERRSHAQTKRADGRMTILVRLEESYAPYMVGTDESWSEKVLSQIAKDFPGHRLVALCRYDDQLARIKERFGSTFTIPEQAVDGAGMIEDSDVFVGLGGTMTAEAALLGVPAVSAFQGTELYTEKYLLSKRLLLRAKSPPQVSACIRASLDEGYAAAFRKRAKVTLDAMEDPAEAVKAYLESLSPLK